MSYGLPLARRYAQLLGCEIVFDYRPSDITALTLTCPVRKVASEIIMPGTGDAQEAGAA